MQPARPTRRSGALIAIGGNEDKTDGKDVLKAVLAASQAAGSPAVAVLTAASGEPARQWSAYREAFESLGAKPSWLDLRTRADAECPQRLERLAHVDVLFITGGDQERLGRLLHGTALHRAMARRQRRRAGARRHQRRRVHPRHMDARRRRQ